MSEQPKALALADALAWDESDTVQAAAAELRRLHADVEQWKDLYRRAVNEANGLTNYVEDRPELRGAEKRLTLIQAQARQAIDAAKDQA